MDYADYKRLQHLIEPCQTVDELDEYIQTNFNIYLPWDIVDEKSTSSTLKFTWEVYNYMLTGEGDYRHVLACSRNAMKTLGSAIIQYFSMIHFRRDGAHVAATLSQSGAVIEYIDNLASNPLLQQFKEKDNTKLKRFILPPNDFSARSTVKIQVITASKRGANAPRASCLTFDEVDLTPREILSEVAYVADPSVVPKTEDNIPLIEGDPSTYDPFLWKRRNGESESRNTVFVYLSSRKSNSGPIQDLIDEANKPDAKNITLHMWSAVDFMKKCEPSIHKPELPRVTAHMNVDSLKVVWGDEIKNVSEAQKSRYRAIPAYEGCRTCTAFVACQGRSPNQRGTSPSLRNIEFVEGILKTVGSPPAIIAQMLNEKPETTGLVFPTFERHKHHLSPIDFFEFAMGYKYNPYNIDDIEYERIIEEGDREELSKITPNKTETYKAMVKEGWIFTNGVDYGGVDTATSLLTGFHKKTRKIAMLHLEAETGHGNESWSDHISLKIFPRFPFSHACPDVSAGGGKVVSSFFRKHQIHSRDVKPNRIETGVSQLRDALWDVTAQESRFAIYDDTNEENNNELLVKNMEQWTHVKDPLGRYKLDKFMDDDNTHTIDALRYAIDEYAEYKQKGKISVGSAKVRTRDEYVHAVVTGNKEAVNTALVEAMNFEEQARQHMLREFGVDIKPPKPKDDIEKEADNKRKTVKFRF